MKLKNKVTLVGIVLRFGIIVCKKLEGDGFPSSLDH